MQHLVQLHCKSYLKHLHSLALFMVFTVFTMKNCMWLHICMVEEPGTPPYSKMIRDLQASRQSESDKLDTGEIQNANSKPQSELETTNPLQSPPDRLFKSHMSCGVHGIFINLASQMRSVSILTGSIFGGKNPTDFRLSRRKMR